MSSQQSFAIKSYPATFDVTNSADLGVLERPRPSGPAAGEVVIDVKSAALNPGEAILARAPYAMLGVFFSCPKEEQPLVLGSDLSGVVTAVGSGAAFKVGDRVLAHAELGNNDGAGYQQVVKLPAEYVVKIPDNMSHDEAASIPMAYGTAAHALYYYPNLKAPWAGGESAGKPILIFGGSTSVGQYAIQLAKMSDYSPIIVTASASHESHLKSLGATHVLPRSTTNEEITKVAGGPIPVIFDSVGRDPSLLTAAVELVSSPSNITSVNPQMTKVESPKDITWTAVMTHTAKDEILANLQGLLGKEIKPNRVEVLPGGLKDIENGLNRLNSGGVSGVKLIVNP